MAKSKRVQVLMEPQEFDALERLARKRGTSVADLMREAVRGKYLVGADRASRARALRNFLDLPNAPLPDWRELKEELEAHHDKGLS